MAFDIYSVPAKIHNNLLFYIYYNIWAWYPSRILTCFLGYINDSWKQPKTDVGYFIVDDDITRSMEVSSMDSLKWQENKASTTEMDVMM